jgi:transketolase
MSAQAAGRGIKEDTNSADSAVPREFVVREFMEGTSTALHPHGASIEDLLAPEPFLLRKAILKLLELKDSDIRILNIQQCRDAVDKGLHAGGAASAVIPLTALFYGGFISLDIADPTRRGQDMFVLSKGHAVATLASIYADLGYFDPQVLKNSRSYESILNGHPGPLLPGVQIATGPMGQGLSVAQGFAIAGRMGPRFDSYCMAGDGELQEGPIWEAVMFAATRHLDNFCVLVDQNNGQLDIASKTIFPMPDLEKVFEAFGWRSITVDATQYDSVYEALPQFRYGPRNGKPTAIICRSTKGHGSLSDFLNKHKVAMADSLIEQELALQAERRRTRAEEVRGLYASLEGHPKGKQLRETILELARSMHLSVERDSMGDLHPAMGPVLTRRVPRREKRVTYDASLLPRIDKAKEYSAGDIVTAAMKVFARHPAVVSIDSDLATTSGLEAGIAAVDQRRALNVGVAEANMMCIGEAFAALGYNTWISTFCPFYDWKVLRRIAVGHQERMEAMASPNGWLSEGHGLDLTMLATGPNFETRTNGATHMGNDDIIVFDGIAHLRIVDVSCPRQLLAVMRWIMEGNRGLIYLRVMRAPSGVLYDPDFAFEFGRGYVLRENLADVATIITSNRGTHEALAAAKLAEAERLGIGVVDMPSVDEDLLLRLYDAGKLLCFAEQNNGYLLQNFLRILYRHRKQCDWNRVMSINTLNGDGKPQFIHSGTYEELLEAFRLSPPHLVHSIRERIRT